VPKLDVGSGNDTHQWLPDYQLCEPCPDDSVTPEWVWPRNALFQGVSSKTPLPVPDGYYDVVRCAHMWHCVDNEECEPGEIEAFVEELTRITSHGGILFFIEPEAITTRQHLPRARWILLAASEEVFVYQRV